jgi:superoxide dismutase, Cu-Zn family
MHHPHALPDKENRHAGDFGNLESDENGNANFKLTVDNISLAGRLSPIIGRGVVVHAKLDDGSQPSGNAGDRIAVGVLGVRNPKD